jgi:hypothetical protein
VRLARWWGVALVAVTAAVRPGTGAADEAGIVVRVNGTPSLRRGDQTEALRRGAPVHSGDVIETDGSSKAKIILLDDSVLAIGPKSRVGIDEFVLDSKGRTARLQVLGGRFKLAILKLFGGRTDYEVRTPTAVAGIRGTVLWGDTELDAICALDGNIEVRPRTGAGAAAQLGGGECVTQMRDGKTAPLKPTAEELAGFLREVTLD